MSPTPSGDYAMSGAGASAGHVDQHVAEDLWTLMVPVDDLDMLPGNPRRGSVDAIARSYARFGQRKPVVARRSAGGRGVVTAGNHQLAAARRLGWDRIAVVWTDDDDATAEAFALADNRTAELGDYDDLLLLEMIDRVGAADPELLADTAFGLSDVEALRRLVAASRPAEVLTDPDAVPAAPTEPVASAGDVWQLGPHRLICGDSRDSAAVERLMAGGRADMVWTDPPYGVGYGEKNRFLQTIGRSDRLEEDIQGDGADPVALAALLGAAFRSALDACRPGAVWFVAAPAGPQLGVFAAELLKTGVWRQLLCWVKNRPIFGRSDYHYQHENLFYGWAPGAAHHPPPTHSTSSLWAYDSPAASKLHPTMKPVALIAQAVRDHTGPAEVVLDPFAGSGSTLIACHQEGRVARLVEIDPVYCDVIVQRWAEHTGGTPHLEGAR